MGSAAPVDLIPLDPDCPACSDPHDVGEAFDGSALRCANCGVRLVCVVWTDRTASMIEIRRQPYKLTGRAATRARWRRRGRR